MTHQVVLHFICYIWIWYERLLKIVVFLYVYIFISLTDVEQCKKKKAMRMHIILYDGIYKCDHTLAFTSSYVLHISDKRHPTVKPIIKVNTFYAP